MLMAPPGLVEGSTLGLGVGGAPASLSGSSAARSRGAVGRVRRATVRATRTGAGLVAAPRPGPGGVSPDTLATGIDTRRPHDRAGGCEAAMVTTDEPWLVIVATIGPLIAALAAIGALIVGIQTVRQRT